MGNEAEFAIPLTSLGLAPGDAVDFILFGENAIIDLVPDNYTSSVITYTIVPEPTTPLLCGLGALAVLRRRKRAR